MRYPRNLKKGDYIGVTAPSAGITNQVKLLRLDNVKNRKQIANIKEKLEELEKANGIELSEKQREAIYSVSKNNVCVITGGPGTGKTTIIKSIIDLYKNEGKKVVLCAPTRKSCKEND